MTEDEATIEAYATKEVDFRFRGIDFHFHLSHGLFSSADIDSGTRFLLRALSRHWDEQGLPRPPASGKIYILDAGSGIGVIGIAVQRALEAEGIPAQTRSQDRDELARAFTAGNAKQNALRMESLEARAEGLLDGCNDGAWDLILSNLPAKAGNTVLEAFFARAARLLSASGLLAVVIVNPLAAPARVWIEATPDLALVREEKGSDHTVFLCTKATGAPAMDSERGSAAALAAAYRRGRQAYTLEGTSYEIEALHGLASFDSVSHGAALAAKLLMKVEAHVPSGPILLHEDDQGHLASWLAARIAAGSLAPRPFTLAGRNAVSLLAGERNARRASSSVDIQTLPLVDLALWSGAAPRKFGLILSFPEKVPRIDRTQAIWNGLAALLANGGVCIAAMESTEAERFDRHKPKGFTRLGDIKRNGFRALAYGGMP